MGQCSAWSYVTVEAVTCQHVAFLVLLFLTLSGHEFDTTPQCSCRRGNSVRLSSDV